ncbi:MAG: hypothetical protein ACTHML_08275 [Ginsengibacter sp.]
MKHLTILVPDSQSALSTVSCIAGAYDFFSRANHYRKINGQKDLFKIALAGPLQMKQKLATALLLSARKFLLMMCPPPT